MWKGNDKYYWSEDTLYHFHFISSYISKQEVLEKVKNFIEVECQLQENDCEDEMAKDLINKIYENR